MASRSTSAADWFSAGVRLGVRKAGDPPRWERCVNHRSFSVREFAAQHFGEPHRRILLIGGAGFDPRALTTARLLMQVADGRVDGFFLRERRPGPRHSLLARAENQITQLRGLINQVAVVDIPVFEPDGAVGIGRRVVDALKDIDLTLYTDIVIDFSALSIGSSFPAAKLILERLESVAVLGRGEGGDELKINLHAFVTASPSTDDLILPNPSLIVGPVHGFRGRFDIDETVRAAKLWMPQLRVGFSGMLDRLYSYLTPDDVVPVLPFPAHDPRLGDRLIEHYASEFEGRWGVDARSIVYADEINPLDYYRTVLRIDDGRNPVFASTGGSLLLLSPIGSKALAIGAMMAAMERDLPVIYVEALSFSASLEGQDSTQYGDEDLVHVWLLGEVYPMSKVGV